MSNSWNYSSLAGKLAELGAFDAARSAMDIAAGREKWEAEALRRCQDIDAQKAREALDVKPQSQRTQASTITSDQVLDLLRNGTAAERKAFLLKLPLCSLLGIASFGITSESKGIVVVSLTGVIQKYCAGTNAEIGATLADAVHRRAVELWLADPSNHNDLLATTLSGLAVSHVNALGLLGRYKEQRNAADTYVGMYGFPPLVALPQVMLPRPLNSTLEYKGHVVFEPSNLPALMVSRIAAQVGLRRIDEAKTALSDLMVSSALIGHPAAAMEALRLKGKVDQYMQDATKLASEGTDASAPASGESMIKMLKDVLGNQFEGKQRKELLAATDRLDPNNRLDPNDPDQRALVNDLIKASEEYQTKGKRPDMEDLLSRALDLSKKLKKGR